MPIKRIHELVAKKVIDARPLITHTFPFEQALEAIEACKAQDAIKGLTLIG